jgi:hypothetical protein
MNDHPKPVHEVRLGVIKAAVWRNETENGPRFNTTFSRSYRDGEQWKNSDSFSRDDLLLVAKIANEAHSWIFAQAREAPSAPVPNGGSQGSRPNSSGRRP